MLDVDALARAENENWVFKGSECLRPEKPGEPYRHCIVSLSRGGADAVVMREFDLIDKAFVADGFSLPDAKQDVSWQDHDALWVGTDFGPGSMTTSGYPRIVKSWTRGTPLSSARTVYEGKDADVGVVAFSERDSGVRRDWVRRSIAFWSHETFLQRDGRLIRLDIPNDASPGFFKRWLLVTLRTPWSVAGKTWPGGALLVIDFEAFIRGDRNLEALYAPSKRSTLEATSTVRDAILISELDNVRARLWVLRFDGRTWQRTRVSTPENAQIGIGSTYWDSNEYFTTLQDFTTPTTLQMRSAESPNVEALKSLPQFFDAEGIDTSQFEATSKDGTKILYFIAHRAGLKLDASNPTLVYGYGGFQNSELPWYSGAFGKGWLEPGGVFVLANLRGGGEFGPDWHRAAQKENKQRTGDDMAAVAEDLIRRKITSPKHLGILGGSQGGLLVTATMVQRPELFGAVVSQVPLIDMLRYHKLLAGASWIARQAR